MATETIKDGGPVFPQLVYPSADGVIHDGMSLRDYFAAHAPEVPDWFDIQPLPKPTRPAVPEHWDHDLRDRAKDWLLDPCYDLSTAEMDAKVVREVKEWVELCNKYWDGLKLRESQQKLNRYFTWRWFYADQMVRNHNQPLPS